MFLERGLRNANNMQGVGVMVSGVVIDIRMLIRILTIIGGSLGTVITTLTVFSEDTAAHNPSLTRHPKTRTRTKLGIPVLLHVD